MSKIVQLIDKEGNNIYPNTKEPEEIFSFGKLYGLSQVYYRDSAIYDTSNKTITVSTGGSIDWYTPTIHDKNIGYNEFENAKTYGMPVNGQNNYVLSSDFSFNTNDVRFQILYFSFDESGALIGISHIEKSPPSKAGTLKATVKPKSQAKYMCIRFSIRTANVTGTISNISVKEITSDIVQLTDKDGNSIYPMCVLGGGTQLKARDSNIYPVGIPQPIATRRIIFSPGYGNDDFYIDVTYDTTVEKPIDPKDKETDTIIHSGDTFQFVTVEDIGTDSVKIKIKYTSSSTLCHVAAGVGPQSEISYYPNYPKHFTHCITAIDSGCKACFDGYTFTSTELNPGTLYKLVSIVTSVTGYGIAWEKDTDIRTLHKFSSWQLNGEDFDFSTPITSDITLTGTWI